MSVNATGGLRDEGKEVKHVLFEKKSTDLLMK
jgi:hypothetical protein